mmetsp:Transcript_33264/g.66193  ORF Transcript_33264/g.66193 Transcript_33264/m.66193 type:complete len:273 (+) Transcript_33264:367-1185(+)
MPRTRRRGPPPPAAPTRTSLSSWRRSPSNSRRFTTSSRSPCATSFRTLRSMWLPPSPPTSGVTASSSPPRPMPKRVCMRALRATRAACAPSWATATTSSATTTISAKLSSTSSTTRRRPSSRRSRRRVPRRLRRRLRKRRWWASIRACPVTAPAWFPSWAHASSSVATTMTCARPNSTSCPKARNRSTTPSHLRFRWPTARATHGAATTVAVGAAAGAVTICTRPPPSVRAWAVRAWVVARVAARVVAAPSRPASSVMWYEARIAHPSPVFA